MVRVRRARHARARRSHCGVCFSPYSDLFQPRMTCCNYAACGYCRSCHYESQVNRGQVNITCINCSAIVSRVELTKRLRGDARKNYDLICSSRKGIIPLSRPCPRCDVITPVTKDDLSTKEAQDYGLQVCTLYFIG